VDSPEVEVDGIISPSAAFGACGALTMKRKLREKKRKLTFSLSSARTREKSGLNKIEIPGCRARAFKRACALFLRLKTPFPAIREHATF
jgi:hypothetical protein